MKRRGFLGSVAVLGSGLTMVPGAALSCPAPLAEPLRFLSADSGVWAILSDAMAACGPLDARLEPSARQELPKAFAATPSAVQIGGVANDTITPLLVQDSLRPLDDLIAKHGAGLVPNQLIRVGGRTVALAVAVNTQQFMYRADILADLGISPPQSWGEALRAAEEIRRAGVVAHPLGAALGVGWDLTQAFVDMFTGFGGAFFAEDNTATLAGDAGQQALETLQALSVYVHPDYLETDSAAVQRRFQTGEIAMGPLWADRAAAVQDPAVSLVVGQIAVAPALRATAEGPPAATLWWEGAVIAKGTTDAQAEAALQLIIAALSPETIAAHNDAAIWLAPGYRPSAAMAGATATAASDPMPPSYPSTQAMAVLRGALDAELPAFFRAQRSAPETLAAIEAAYRGAAQAADLLK